MAVSIYFAVSLTAGYLVTFGISVAIVGTWYVVKKLKNRLLKVFVLFAATATVWFLGVDYSWHSQSCHSCLSKTERVDIRIVGIVIHSRSKHLKTDVALALQKIERPCLHDKVENRYLQRHWGLLICSCPCQSGVSGLAPTEPFSQQDEKLFNEIKRHSDLADKLYEIAIEKNDFEQFWQTIESFSKR